jgi:hypothetical protein
VIAPTNSIQPVLSAVHFAARKHANQRRKGVAAEPYINHLIEVAELVCGALEEPDTNLVIAALLHDTIEDAGVTKEELAERFGQEVANLVAEVTDNKLLPKHERKRLQIENAPTKSIGAQAIQLADKVSNLRGILTSAPVGWDLERKKEYFAWAALVVAGFTKANPVLKAEFDLIIQRSSWNLPSQSSMDGEPEPLNSRIIDAIEQSLRAGITGYSIIGGVSPKGVGSEAMKKRGPEPQTKDPGPEDNADDSSCF